MENKRKEKVANWLQEVNKQDETFNHVDFKEIEKDAIEAAGPLCGALSRALDSDLASAKHYNLACHELSNGALSVTSLANSEQAGAVIRYLLALASRIDAERHSQLARLLLTNRPPFRLLDAANLDRYRRLCLLLASRHPDLRHLAIETAVGWFYPDPVESESESGGTDDFRVDRLQFNLAHRLLEALASAFPASAPSVICDFIEQRCLWGRPTRQLACYLLNMLRAAATYLASGDGGGLRIRLLFVACRTVAKLERLADEAAVGGEAAAACSCSHTVDPAAARLVSRPPSDCWWKLTPDLHSVLQQAGPAAARNCRVCDRRLKLNACLHPLLCFVRSELDSGDWPRIRAMYKDLLTVLDRELIHLAGPSRIHLLLALACSANDRIAHGFLDYLWKRAIDSRLGDNLQLRCLALLGDLCARCAFVHSHLLHTVLLLLVDRARLMASRYNKRSGALNSDEVSLFHACVRAVVRIAVHRHRELLGGGSKDAACLAGMHFHLVLRSASLHPWPALPADLRARFALLCSRYRLDEFNAAIAALSDGDVNDAAAPSKPDADGALSAKKRRKRRRTTLDPAAAAAAALAVVGATDEPLSASLDGLSLCEPLLRPLLLPVEEPPPLPAPPLLQEPAAGELLSKQPPPQSLASSTNAAPVAVIVQEPPPVSLAEALLGPFVNRRRKRLRSDCVVFGESS